MRRRRLFDPINKHEKLLVLSVLILGVLLRTLFLDSLPLGLNQDEASAGYEAWALFNYGVDRNGDMWPVMLTSWGSGQNILYSWLAIPFIAVFGLEVLPLRLVSALAGCITLFIFWLLARRARSKGFALTALLILSLNPWHIMISRWALESNLLPLYLLLGIYFTSRAKEKPFSLLWASMFFGFSLYAYGTAFFFLPFFLVAALIWLRKELDLRVFAPALLIFVIIALPITLCQIVNLGNGSSGTFLGMTLPRLTESRYMANTVFGGGGLSAARENFSGFIRILIIQSDALSFNAIDNGGLYYFFGLPLAALGLVVSVAAYKDYPGEMPIVISLVVCFIAAFFIDPNINRMNMVFLPIIYFSSLGTHVLLCKLSRFAAIPLAGILACAVLFLNSYIYEFNTQGSEAFFPGLGDAIIYVESVGAQIIYITNYVNQPYIFALFYSRTPPYEFQSTVDYINPDGDFRHVRSYGKYRFGDAADASGEYLILHLGEYSDQKVLQRFGNYVVCEGSM